MHIPDGVLDVKTVVTTSILGAGALAYSAYKVRSELTIEKVKQMAVVGAFIFAAQMINMPITDGISGHLLGAAIAAILLGPWLGTITMSLVLIVQSLVFADGGFFALGANIVCAGFIATIVSYIVQATLKGKVNQIIVSLLAGWLSLIAGSAAIGLTLVWSNALSFMNIMQTMTSIHAQIGVVEAIITAGVIFAVTYKAKENSVIQAKEGA